MEHFLIDNFIYIVIVIAFIVLALIGYIVDKSKTNKLKKEYQKKNENEQLNIPISSASSETPTTMTNYQPNDGAIMTKQD